MIRTTLAAACGLVLMATASYAATIDVREIKKQTTVMLIYTAVIITGDIELGDDAKLLAILEADPRITGNNNAIILNSPGGRVLPGVRIGEMIKWRGLATWVANGNVCSSVCAAMWLAGSIRYAAGSARIGFHAAFQGTLGQPTTYKRSAPGSAAMQEYYGRIGVKPETATFLVNAADPREMFWLTDSTAKQLGIAWQLLNMNPERAPCLASFRPSTCF